MRGLTLHPEAEALQPSRQLLGDFLAGDRPRRRARFTRLCRSRQMPSVLAQQLQRELRVEMLLDQLGIELAPHFIFLARPLSPLRERVELAR